MDMSEDKRDLELLFIEKFLGTLSAEQNQYADHLIASSAEAAALWNELQQRLNKKGTSKWIKEINEEERWEQLLVKLGSEQEVAIKKRKYRSVLPYMTAAAVLIILPLFWLFVTGKFDRREGIKSDFPALHAADAGIVLSMADGKVLTLGDEQTRDIKLKGGRIQVNNGRFSYVGGGAQAAAQLSTLSVPAGKDYKLLLADGTEVWMNASSSLQFPLQFNGDKREVTLIGEAYFKVRKDLKRPFVVHALGNSIEVLGTSFNVSAYDKMNFSASLVEGKVKALSAGQQIILAPGKQVYMENNVMKEQAFDQNEILSWMNGLYYFNNKPLTELSGVIERWFNVKVVMPESIAGRRFTGAFEKNKPLNEVMSNLELSGNVHSRLKDGVLYLN